MAQLSPSLFQFVLCCLVAGVVSFPQLPLVNQGPQTGPLTPAYGDLVQTPRGLASIALEGFSEDLDQDGFVDPVVQAALPVAVAAPAVGNQVFSAPVAAAAPAPFVSSFSVAAPATAAFVSSAPVAAAAPAVFGSSVPVGASAAGGVYNYPVGSGCVNTWGAPVPCAL